MTLSRTARPERNLRQGGISPTLIVAILMVAGVTGGGLYFWQPWKKENDFTAALLVHPVKRDVFIYDVTEQGEVESSRNTEVVCEVQSKNSAGTMIIEIIPEGTNVKAGDFLVRLDSSAINEELSQQQIVCNTSEAALIQAENVLRTAEISKEEYLNGTFRQEEQLILSEMSVSEENLRRAEDYLLHSQKLASKGYVTSLQLDADRFAVEKAKMDLDTAKTKLHVLRDYTRAKMISQLEADIKTAEANLKSQESIHALDMDKLKHIQEQLKKCVIVAPSDGQVVYANQNERRGGSEFVVEPGAMVRERQAIIRLPDPTKMQVKAKINESRIDRVRPGQPAVIRLDAFPELELTGVVTKVDDYPLPGSWFSAAVKEYGTLISIDEPPPGTRPGMTAEVRVRVEQAADALQIPVQAVVERNGYHFAMVPTKTAVELRQLKLGSTNDKFVIVQDGLNDNESVVVNPRKHLERVVFPDLPPVDNKQLLAERRRATEAKGASDREAGGTTARDTQLATTTAVGSGGEQGEGRQRRRREGGGPGGMNMTPAAIVDMAMQNDKDGDGKLSNDEADERLRGRFAQVDSNNDGFVDRAELTASITRMLNAARAGGGGGPVAAPNASSAGL
jgi:RND family efflux transporter MFP subunit